jgi:hypothetical protein
MRTKTWDCNPYQVALIEQSAELCELFVFGPLHYNSYPSSIKQFHDSYDASIKRSEDFARNVTDAVQTGFSVMGHIFRHHDGREIHVSNALDIDRTQQNFISLLNQRMS